MFVSRSLTAFSGDQPPYDQLHQHFHKYGVDNYDNFITGDFIALMFQTKLARTSNIYRVRLSDPPEVSEKQADESEPKDTAPVAASDVVVEKVEPKLTEARPKEEHPSPKSPVEERPKAKTDRLTMVVDVGVDDAPLAAEDRVVKPVRTSKQIAVENTCIITFAFRAAGQRRRVL